MANAIADYLMGQFEEVQPLDFYRDIFGDGNLDEDGSFNKGKYTGIAIELTYDDKGKVSHRKKHIITDDLDKVDELVWKSDNFCLMAPVSYAGWSRKTANARTMYALGVEIDNLIIKKNEDGSVAYTGLDNLIHQCNTFDRFNGHTYLPKPTYLVASGNGVHLYYVFDRPLRLTEWVKKSLMLYKDILTRMLWNPYITTTSEEDKIQFESAFQGFRMPGTATKLGMQTKDRKDRVRAFLTGEKVSLDYMNSFLLEEQIKQGAKISPTYEGTVRLSEAKEKWPEWYQTTVVEGKKYSKKWDIAGKVNGDNPYALYDWWKRKILTGAVVGKRYHCMYCLAVYALKNDVPEEKLVADCYEIMERFEGLTNDPDNHFTEVDVEAALQVFQDEGYFNYPLKKIIKRSGIEIERNKRNGRKQEVHLGRVRALQQYDDPEGNWRNKDGRPKGSGTKEQIIREYLQEHPEETNKSKIAKDLNIDRKTVHKFFDKIKAEL